jgi:CheY-like chemotaxis protein
MALLLQNGKPDVIVLDWSMPGADGGEVLDSIRGDPRTRDLRVVVLSALGTRDHES